MSTSSFFRVLSSILLAGSSLSIGCASDLGSDAEQTDPSSEAAGGSEREPGEPPSTRPLEPVEEVLEAPAEEVEAPVEDQQAPSAAADASGKTDACGAVPAVLTRDNTARRSSSSGYTEYTNTVSNLLTRLQTKLTVPAKPPASGTIFLWPGVQPIRGPHFAPINNGVLQPVLTWGSSCAPGSPYGYSSWWISGLYVNVSTSQSAYRNCHGGPVMRVNVGDVLGLDIALTGTVWKQTIKNLTSGQQVDYSIDLRGQEQGRAIFDIELPTRAKPVSDVVFTETVLTYARPRTASCVPATQGASDFISKARLSSDKTKCCIDRITLRAQGVKATTTP